LKTVDVFLPEFQAYDIANTSEIFSAVG
jgi:hypothetical protein